MKINILDRIISILSYCTFGFFGLIALVFSYLKRTSLSSFVLYNVYQSIFISILLTIFSILYGIALNFISAIPVVGAMVVQFDKTINYKPLFMGMPLVSIFMVMLLLYFIVPCFIGVKPYLYGVSDVVKSNLGE